MMEFLREMTDQEKQYAMVPGTVIIPSSGDDLHKETKKVTEEIKEFADMAMMRLIEVYPDLLEDQSQNLLWTCGGRFELAIQSLVDMEDSSATACQPAAGESEIHDLYLSALNPAEPDVLAIEDVGFNPEKIVGDCQICFCDVTEKENSALSCNHVICRSCVTQHLSYRIKDGKVDAARLTCPMLDCDHEYNTYHVLVACSNEMLQKMIRFRIERAFEQNPFARWCYNKDCGTLLIADPKKRLVQCTTCNKKMCFKCNKKYHFGPCMPSKIDFAQKKWKFKNKAKKCPRCRFLIVKSQGCNHMTCAKCYYEFCWLCGKKYTLNHFDGPFGCNSSRAYNIWGPNKPVRVVTKTIGGTVLVAVGVTGLIVASPYLIWSNRDYIFSKEASDW